MHRTQRACAADAGAAVYDDGGLGHVLVTLNLVHVLEELAEAGRVGRQAVVGPFSVLEVLHQPVLVRLRVASHQNRGDKTHTHTIIHIMGVLEVLHQPVLVRAGA